MAVMAEKKVSTVHLLSFPHCTGTAPISKDVLNYFMSLDIPIMEGYGLSESMSIASMCFITPFMFREKSVGKVSKHTLYYCTFCTTLLPYT